jgi:hypothetical protein
MREAPNQELLWRIDEQKSILDLNGTFSCASLTMLTGQEIQVSPDYADYAQCRCTAGRYGVPKDQQCKPCPPGCDCSKGGHALSWPKGYYPIYRPPGTYMPQPGLLHLDPSTDQCTTRRDHRRIAL